MERILFEFALRSVDIFGEKYFLTVDLEAPEHGVLFGNFSD